MKIYSHCIKYLLLLVMMSAPVCAKVRWTTDEWNEMYKLAKSASTFHVSILYNKIRYGKAFTFNPVLNGTCSNEKESKLCVCLSEAGKIMSIHDGKKGTLLLGAIPRYKEHIEEIKRHTNLSAQDKIGLYTLNREFERNWAGLSELEKTEPIISHKYPTTDYGAPSFVDLLRAVRDLENRDSSEEKVAYVHCKAGRGRSATIVSAYLMHVCNKAGISTSPKQIEEYLKAQRPVVSMNSEHHAILERFEKELQQVGSFSALYSVYKDAVEKRDKELAKK